MEFISIDQGTQKIEEFDVLKLTADSETSSSNSELPSKRSLENGGKKLTSAAKPFYPKCKRLMTRAPFELKPPNKSATAHDLKRSSKDSNPPPCNKPSTVPVNGHKLSPKPSSSVGAISLQELMSVEDKQEAPPVKKQSAVGDTDERLLRLKNMLRQAETEKTTLRGYVADLQAKLNAVPKRIPLKCSESQTDENGELVKM